jgi:hypothetical protein
LGASDEERGADHADRDDRSDTNTARGGAKNKEGAEKGDCPEDEVRNDVLHAASNEEGTHAEYRMFRENAGSPISE